MSVIFKYTKYILMFISAIQLARFSPEYLDPILLYEYLVLIAFCFFLGILEDFLKPSKKTNILVRVAIIICSLVLFFTSVSLKSIATIIFSVIMFIAISFSVYLEIRQKD